MLTFAPLLTQLNRSAAFAPVGDLLVSERDVALTLDLPGLTPEDLSIDVQGGELTVRGERKRPQVAEGASYVYAQRPFGVFEHRFQIPAGVDPDAITASMQNGVLSLIVPKPEPRAKRITIGSDNKDLESAEV
jgi:HSP20 family protein